jgi:hypothetical protein
MASAEAASAAAAAVAAAATTAKRKAIRKIKKTADLKEESCIQQLDEKERQSRVRSFDEYVLF